MILKLSRMEKLAATGVAYRYQTEIEEAQKRRNKDVLDIIIEHGQHSLPDKYFFRQDDDGYITSIEWEDTEEECNHE